MSEENKPAPGLDQPARDLRPADFRWTSAPIDPGVHMFGTGEQLAALFTDLAAARAEFGPVKKDRTAAGAKFSYDYATLDECISAVTPALSKYGLAVLQPPVSPSGDTLAICTILTHSAGACLSSTIRFAPSDEGGRMNAMQELGTSITYMRRYSLSGLLSIAPEADTDAGGPPAQKSEPPKQQQAKGPKPPKKQPPAPNAKPPKEAPPPEPEREPGEDEDDEGADPVIVDQILDLLPRCIEGLNDMEKPDKTKAIAEDALKACGNADYRNLSTPEAEKWLDSLREKAGLSG